jgi:hypothetical protein
MKKEEIPQDNSPLVNYFPELCYGKNEKGEYDTVQSTGWEVKTTALSNAWDDISERIAEARKLVESGKKSPVYYFMEKNLMTITILASYVKFNPLRVWWHTKPGVYKKLDKNVIQRYANIFKIKTEELELLN